jgi:hypothetical protein
MKIFKFNEFIINEAVAVKQIIDDFVKFIEKSPEVTFFPEDEEGKVREGWITKEHKLYSPAGIKRYFEEKYGEEYTSLGVDNAISYDPSIKKITKALSDKGMTFQKTPIKGQFGDKTWFYSVDLSDSEIEKIKEKYEAEFSKRYAKHTTAKSASKEVAKKAAVEKVEKKAKRKVEKEKSTPKADIKKSTPKKPTKKAPAKKKPSKVPSKPKKKNEALDLLFEGLFSI